MGMLALFVTLLQIGIAVGWVVLLLGEGRRSTTE